MKKCFYVFMLMIALAFCSCEKKTDVELTAPVRIEVLGLNQSFESFGAPRRASGDLTNAKLTDLWIFEGTTLLAHQTSSDSDFGYPTLQLKYGDHSLNFIASGASYQNFGSYWITNKIGDTFASHLSINVDQNTSEQSIVLTRANYSIVWQSNDNVPSSVKYIGAKLKNFNSGLSDGIIGINPIDTCIEYNITSYVGKTIKITASGFPTTQTEEENIITTLYFLDENRDTLTTINKIVPVLANRKTILSGQMFGSSLDQPITVNTEYLPDYEESLY